MRLRIREWQPQWTLLALMVTGVVLLVTSYILGIDSYAAPLPAGQSGTRETGYASALNWSLNLVVIFPIVAYFMLSALQAVPKVLRKMENRKMFRDHTGDPVPAVPILEQWTHDSGATTWLLRGSVLLGAAIALGECFITNLLPLWHNQLRRGDPEVDWGVAMIGQSLVRRVLGGAFDVVAFALEGVMIASVLSFFILMLRLPGLLYSGDNSGVVVVPDLVSEDPRRGFEVFEPLLWNTLYASLFAYLLFYLSRIQNVYVRSTNAHSLWEFVESDVVAGFKKGGLSSFATAPVGAPHSDFSSVLVSLGGMIVIVITILIVSGTVRKAAESARETAGDFLARFRDQSRGLTVLGREEDAKRCRSMEVWPLRYLTFNLLLTICLAAAATIVFYRLGLVTFGAVLAAIVTTASGKLIGYFKS